MPIRHLLAALLSLVVAASAFGQTVTLPAEIKGETGEFLVVKATTDDTLVKWFVIDKGLKLFPQELQNDTRQAVVIALATGRYRLLAVSAKDDKPSDFAQCMVTIGQPGPDPPPPGPDPPPPDPPPGPTPAGARSLLIFRETADSTPQLARLLTSLRSGPAADYLSSKKHRLDILDDDAVGSDGAPSPLVEQWRKHFADLPFPVLIIAEKTAAGTKLLHRQSLPAGITADQIIEIVKKFGG